MIKAVKFFIILLSLIFLTVDIHAFCSEGEENSKQESKIKRRYLAVFPDGKHGIDVIEHPVDGDNDCGFHTLEVTRDQLIEDLLPARKDKEAREFLAPEIRHAFLFDEISEALRPSTWSEFYQPYQRAWENLEQIMKIIKSHIEEPYPESLGLEERVTWLTEKTHNPEHREELREIFEQYNESSLSIDQFCQNPKTFKHYINLYLSPHKLWLGYKSTLLWARMKQLNLHIWRQSDTQEDVLTLVDAHTSFNALKTIHMLHTSGFTHFNLLEEVTQRNLKTERKQIRAWNKTRADFPTDVTLFDLFAHQVSKTPKALAVISAQKNLTYEESYLRGNRIGHALLENGINPNQLVGILMAKGWEQVVGCLGILASGAAFLPIDPNWPESRIQRVLKSGKVKLVLTQQAILEKLSQSDLLSSYRCLAVDNDEIWNSYSEDPFPRQQSPKDIAYVIFTSGSTGQPKGVVISHEGVVNTLFDINERFQVTSQDRVLALSNLTFDLNIYDIFGTLATGGSIVLPDVDKINEPAHWLKAVIQQDITIWNTVPMFMQMLVEYLDYLPIPEKPHLANTLRTILLSGDWIPLNLPDRIRQYFSNSQIISLGGATEGSIWSILYPITGEVPPTWKSIPYGRPMANQSMYVLDQDFNHCPMGVLGSIYIGGTGVALGYWRDKEKTSVSFMKRPVTGERLYKTGDLGRWNAEGYMEFVGRKDTQVKIDGYRVELGDIEAALSQHPSVKQNVVSTYQKGSHKKLVAYVVPDRRFIENFGTKEDPTEDWSKIYEEVYQERASSKDLTFNIAGWNSSYTGKPIPAEEMQEWVSHTVERILSLKPISVLEIGCGTGLLVSRIASFCETYVATDISKTALELIASMKSSLEGLNHVVTYQKPADDFNELDLFSFDTIVINSVTQCFPSVDYLVHVIIGAARLLKQGGHLFIGDMRNLALLKSHHASVQLHQASDFVTKEEFAQRIQSHIEKEEELLIDPLFFYALKSKIPQIQHVQIHLKKGKYPNELNRFRFDATLEMGEESIPTVIPTYQPWSLEKVSLPTVWHDPLSTFWDQLLEWKMKCSKEMPQALGFKGLPNARLQTETLALDWLNGDLDVKTVGELKTYKSDYYAIDPASLYQLGRDLGLHVEITWNPDKPMSLFDVIFIHASKDTEGPILIAHNQDCLNEVEQYTNYPMLPRVRRPFTSLLKEHCQTKLPSYMVPTSFTLLEHLPLSSNGKVDRKALPILTKIQQSEEDYASPMTTTERMLTDLWAEVLGIDGIGINDNFFDLGGSSLLAVCLMMKCNHQFNTNHPISILFTHNTPKQLATVLQDEKKPTSYRPLLPFHQDGKKPPLFFVHSGRGGAEAYVTLASHFDRDQPIYAIESYNLCNTPPLFNDH